MSQKLNHLADSKSPYLLQHADNPVDWYPWGTEALEKAKNEDKPILLSIGYSSCHWCHVMAHESFEDESVANLMNEHFVNIKLDREERPDIDQIYMDAIQAMGLNGGWPLNVFLTPEQKPFYGGTYFPKDRWIALLNSVDDAFKNKRDQLNESANKFAEAINVDMAKKFRFDETSKLTDDAILSGYYKMAAKFDKEWGGLNRSPKFPLPSIWRFMHLLHDKTKYVDIEQHLIFTLEKIYQGGIYDHVGGGFARYSVDGQWHVPHFEKMLYDNGQLLSLYSEVYKNSKNPLFKTVILETAEWLKNEMQHESGGFYAALDADSEGEEGKFYVWSMEEIMEVSGKNSEVIMDAFDVSAEGNWEGKNVLRRLKSSEEILNKHELSADDLENIVSNFRSTALKKRNERIRPGLDNKLISGWNGLAVTGLLDAYQATGEETLLDMATRSFEFLKREMIQGHVLMHVNSLLVSGFMDDYAAVIQSFIKYYETTFDQEALALARNLTETCFEQFYNEQDHLFFYTADESENLIARKKEIFDNVIPASNSIMAENLFKLGLYFDEEKYTKTSDQMLNQVSELVEEDIEFMSQWALLGVLKSTVTPEIVILGEESMKFAAEFNARSMPNKIIMASTNETDLPLMKDKVAIGGKTTIYVCFNKTCKLPVYSIDEALQQIP